MRKRLQMLFMLFFILAAAFNPAGAWAEPFEEEIQLEVEGGFNGICKLGAWVPIHIKINSLSRDVSGEIQVEANLNQANKILIAKPLELQAGIEQELYFEVPVPTAHKSINIYLVEDKKQLAEEELTFTRLLSPEIALIGVMSEDPEAFGWLNGNTIPFAQNNLYDEKMKIMIASGQISQPLATSDGKNTYQKKEAVVVSLDRNDFPGKTEVMDGFDIILISKFDTGLLSDIQISTLEKWVDSGGILMLGTGLSWQKVYHGLPDSLKPFTIQGTKDFQSTELLKDFTGKNTPDMTLKLTQGELGFQYIPVSYVDPSIPVGYPTRFFDSDIIAGDEQNPLVVKYKKEAGEILVFTFDPAAEPFVSWQARVSFMENVFRFLSIGNQRFYEYGNGYYQKQNNYDAVPFQQLATQIPSDKNPPFGFMFISLGIYALLIGPALYLILKKLDKRDLAWVFIPLLSIVFLVGMYLFGFKSRYNSAIINTVSLIDVSEQTNEASVLSDIGVFNDRRGTIKLEYSNTSGLQTPFIQNMENMNYRYSGNDIQGKVVGKYTMGDPVRFEQYNVMLWTPLMLEAERTIDFQNDLLKGVYLKDGKLKGSITNSTPYDLLDAVIIIGNNIIPVGDIIAGDAPLELEIPFNSEGVYKRPEEYLDSKFCRSYYNNQKDYPPDYQEKRKRRSIFENYISQVFNTYQIETKLTLLARNEQTIDYGIVVNDREPEKYNQNLIRLQSDFQFEAGQEAEIPGGIIRPNMYQESEVAWQDGTNSIRINSTGDIEFQFILPNSLRVDEMQFFVESYIPLYVKYNMENNANGYQTEILTNQYEHYLYNTKTRVWDRIEPDATIQEDASRYIDSGNYVRFKIRVVALGQADEEKDYQSGRYKEYQQELLSMPEISLKGVAK